MKDYSRFLDEDIAYREMKELLKRRLERRLTDLEDRKIKWLADWDPETIGVFLDLFDELSRLNIKEIEKV